MLETQGLRCACLAFATLALAGCSGKDDDENDCTPPSISGAPFASSGSGEGQAHGKGQLPAGSRDGLQLDLQVDAGNFSSSVWPDNLFGNNTCGSTFSFAIRELDPGTYRLICAVRDPNSDGTIVAEATSTNSFVITGNENVEFNPTF